MQKKIIYTLVLVWCAGMCSIASAQTYYNPQENGYEQSIGNTRPATSEFRSTSTAIQSTSSFSGGYTVPFAAGEASEIGATSPSGGPRKAPPTIPGGEGNQPEMPGWDQPLGDGVAMLLLTALLYAFLIIRRRRATA